MITNTTVVKAIRSFLVEENLKKSKADRKELENPSLSESEKEILLKKIAEYDEKYQLDIWIKDNIELIENKLNPGTHISKGIHSSSKGDNVHFKPTQSLPAGLVGSQSITELKVDITCDAKYLPLAKFLSTIIDEENDIDLKKLLLTNDISLEQLFSNNTEQSNHYKQRLQRLLIGNFDNPKSDERNKQLLWANNVDSGKNTYTCLIPLYPSSLTGHFYHKINQLRYSDYNKQSSSNRYKKDVSQLPYVSLQNIGVTVLGGTKPQNVSQLTSNQGGRNYLLPSLPPIFKSQEKIRLTQKQTTIFNRRLAYACRDGFNMLYEVVEAEKNIYPERDKRKLALELIAQTVLMQAKYIQNNSPAGWSKDYNLNEYQKYWLDPHRAELDGEDNFKHSTEQNHWTAEIIRQFALWVNACLKWRFKSIQQDFTTPEYNQWCREMEKAIAAQARLNQ